jgi:hypothetical protein
MVPRRRISSDKRDDITGIFDQVDAFVNMSRNNETVEEVTLIPFIDPDDDASGTRYAIWGQSCRRHWKSSGACEIILRRKFLMKMKTKKHCLSLTGRFCLHLATSSVSSYA